MQILKYISKQYAGVCDQDVSFAPGMNVVLGNNETGKSTMLTGIYDTLISHSKLDKRKDKDFISRCFPTDGGNRIDGTVHLLTSEQEMIIEKIWDKTNAKADTILNNKYYDSEAEDKIRELLNYKTSIYNNIVFGRQNNEEAILDWFYSFVNAQQNAKTEESIIEAREKISGAISAAGGISEELYLQKLEERLRELSSNWDVSLNLPKKDNKGKDKGIADPWRNNKGEILQAYYDLEKQKVEFENAKNLIQDFKNLEEKVLNKKKQRNKLKEDLQLLLDSQKDVRDKSFHTQKKIDHEKEIGKLENAKDEWLKLICEKPKLEELLEKREEKIKRDKKSELQDRLNEISDLENKKKELCHSLEGLDDIIKDLNECRILSNDRENIQGRLSSAKLHACIKLLSDCKGEILTADGKEILIQEQYDKDINGYIKIFIPGIIEIIISPQDINIVGLENEIKEKDEKIETILKKYKVENLEKLYEKEEKYKENKGDFDNIETKILRLLNGTNVEDLTKKWGEIKLNQEIDIQDNLEEKIQNILLDKKEETLEARMAVVRSKISGYEDDYISMNELNNKISTKNTELDNTTSILNTISDDVLDAEEFEREKKNITVALYGKNGVPGLEEEIEKLIKEQGGKARQAEDIDLDMLEQERIDLQDIFEQKKHLYHQYDKIKKDFEFLRSQQGDKFAVFYKLFNKYLSVITDGTVQMDDGKLKSDSHILSNKELLSRGTKQTILLAFRLALLKYYYQDEGGILVLDDILLDMDPERRKHSVNLLQEFAKENQIIFTTCDPLIAEMLGGNRINISKK